MGINVEVFLERAGIKWSFLSLKLAWIVGRFITRPLKA
jgi:hypothetical protein